MTDLAPDGEDLARAILLDDPAVLVLEIAAQLAELGSARVFRIGERRLVDYLLEMVL